jgi:hypothetical protein
MSSQPPVSKEPVYKIAKASYTSIQADAEIQISVC